MTLIAKSCKISLRWNIHNSEYHIRKTMRNLKNTYYINNKILDEIINNLTLIMTYRTPYINIDNCWYMISLLDFDKRFIRVLQHNVYKHIDGTLKFTGNIRLVEVEF